MTIKMNLTRFFFAFYICTVASLNATTSSPGTIDSEYMAVLRSGDGRKLHRLLQNGASANARDAAGNSALMHAAVYGDTSFMRVLLKNGADVNATNAAGATALMRASFDQSKVRLLLDQGAKVNLRSVLGNTPLILAARPAHCGSTVRLLLEHGADAKATNDFGATALMAAAASGDEEAARLLIGYGADLNAQPAADHMGFILGGGRSALMWAAFRGDLAMVKLLTEAGADINAMGGLGTALAQATWADRTEAARFLIARGARVNQAGPRDGYAPLHWAASSEQQSASLVKLLLENGANANLGGGEQVDAFMGTPQTPLMLAKRRGDTAILTALTAAGATNGTPDRVRVQTPPARELPAELKLSDLRTAIAAAIPPLQETSIKSKEAFVRHESRQDCTSCHQQHLPMAALGYAKKQHVAVDTAAEQKLIKMVLEGELKNSEVDWEPVFHPDAVFTKGYEAFAAAAQDLPANESADSWVHHLAAIQGKDGQWYNNLPRPPIQTGDIGATALAIHALQHYTFPGRKDQFTKQVEHAAKWLWTAKPENTEGRIYQLLGLAWAGEPARKLQPLAKALVAEQRSDGGWAQLPGLESDAYATSQAVYALRIAVGLKSSTPSIDGGLRYLLRTQLEDGTWHVRRRAFPFQPTNIQSGFPHGKDSWISAAATSWAVLALSLGDNPVSVASAQ